MTPRSSTIQEIDRLAKTYRPNKRIVDALHDKALIGLFGPFSVGKSAIISATVSSSRGFATVETFTTRPLRGTNTDTGRRHIEHTEAELQLLMARMHEGELVQITVHPSTGHIYGTDLASYPAHYNLLDILPSSLSGFERLPFRQFHKYYVVTPLEQWSSRIQAGLQSRYANELNNRYMEAIQNLEWGLCHQSELQWLVNEDGRLDTVAKQVIVHAEQKADSKRGVALAQDMLAYARKQITS